MTLGKKRKKLFRLIFPNPVCGHILSVNGIGHVGVLFCASVELLVKLIGLFFLCPVRLLQRMQ